MGIRIISRLTVTAVFLISAVWMSAASAQTLTLKASDDQTPNYPTVQGLKAMGRDLKRLSHGAIQLKIYPSGQLGDEESVLQQVKAGVIDLARINGAPLANFDSKMGVLSLPYLFKNKQQYHRILGGPIGAELLNSLKSAQMLGLAYYDSGQRSFYTTDKAGPIKSVGDLKGMRIRVQKSKPMIAMVKALGATPVPMSYGDVYSALQNNVISGAENNLPSYGPFGVRHYEVAPNYSFDSHSRVPEVVLISLSSWQKLSAQQQTWVRQAAKDSVAVEETAWSKLVAKTRQALKGKAHFHQVDTAAFQKAMQPVFDQYQGQFGGLLEKIRRAEKTDGK